MRKHVLLTGLEATCSEGTVVVHAALALGPAVAPAYVLLKSAGTRGTLAIALAIGATESASSPAPKLAARTVSANTPDFPQPCSIHQIKVPEQNIQFWCTLLHV